MDLLSLKIPYQSMVFILLLYGKEDPVMEAFKSLKGVAGGHMKNIHKLMPPVSVLRELPVAIMKDLTDRIEKRRLQKPIHNLFVSHIRLTGISRLIYVGLVVDQILFLCKNPAPVLI